MKIVPQNNVRNLGNASQICISETSPLPRPLTSASRNFLTDNEVISYTLVSGEPIAAPGVGGVVREGIGSPVFGMARSVAVGHLVVDAGTGGAGRIVIWKEEQIRQK